MQCYTELVPPTGVTASVYLPFLNADTNNLIVARTSLLQIFSLKSFDHGQDTKLVLCAEFPLSGNITSIGKVKLMQSKSGGDALLVAFRDAKLSLIEWDPAHHSISTISIHYYENHDLLLCPWTPDLRDCVSHLTVDPSSRCAAFNFGVTNLAIIPFHQLADDLAMDDLDDMEDEKAVLTTTQSNGNSNGHNTPYDPSFVLPLTVLDPGLLHPTHLTFLHEYREPTIGILYSSLAQSNNLAPERKDVMSYSVYTLDLEQRASTTLLSINKLPNDLYMIKALPLPVGGSLLLGGNEVVHVDQGGKTNAIGVNEFAKECSSFPMADHSEYSMRLEGCEVESLGNSHGDMLITLATGELVILNFRLDGRSVSGLSLQRVEAYGTASIVKTKASTMTNTDSGRVFIGNEESDSLLITTAARRNYQLKRHGSKSHPKEEDDEEEMGDGSIPEDEDEDDLFTQDVNDSRNGHMVEGSNFRVLDRLSAIAPVNDIAFGRPTKRKREVSEDDESILYDGPTLELAMACCRGRAGALAFVTHELTPKKIKQVKHRDVAGIWSLRAGRNETSISNAYDDVVILSERSEDGTGRSSLMSLSNASFEPKEGTEFDGAADTIAVGKLAMSNHTVQVTANDIRVYDSDFGLSQIFPIVDEDSGEVAQVVSATIMDPYVVFIKDDALVALLKADKNGELDEVDLPDSVPSQEIKSASLYDDRADFFKTSKYRTSTADGNTIILSILTEGGFLGLFVLPELKVQIFQYQGLNFFPSLLSHDLPIPKHWKTPDEIAEIVLSDLGDEIDQRPYLIVLNTTGDVTLYEPFSVPSVEGSYRFQKIMTKNAEASLTADEDDDDPARTPLRKHLQCLHDVGGHNVVFVTGQAPIMIIKTASSRPKAHRIRANCIKHVSSISDPSCHRGFVYVNDHDSIVFSQLPDDTLLTLSDWPTRKIELGHEVSSLAFYDRTESYVLASAYSTEFQLPQDDEWHPEWQEEKARFLPTTTQSSLKLMSAKSYSIISQYNFDDNEQVLSVKCMNLEVSEESHERRDMIVVGTAITKGENVVTRGMLYIFDVVDVVPQPDIPETDLRLKLITKEDVRGAVGAITDIGSQGFLLAAQGQKCMVRGLKEDKSILPVAFVDVRYHIKVARELRGTGLTILGDAFSGLWLMGYSEEPYKLQLLGRDLENPEVVTADFLPDQKQLFIIASDARGELRVLQYDPENPKTERGIKLLLRSSFNTGAFPTTMTLVPRTPVSSEAMNLVQRSSSPDSMDVDNSVAPSHAQHQVLITTQEGSLALITPVSENAYRRLSTLQNILTSNLEQACGLNPRAYRQVETDGIGGRGMIDGQIIKKWLHQSSWHKASMADKVGGSIWEVRGDIEAVSGGGLGYL